MPQTHNATELHWFVFCKNHLTLALDANRNVMEIFCRDHDLIVNSADSYECAMTNVAAQLAFIPPELPIVAATADELR